jgi:hypothetical protein
VAKREFADQLRLVKAAALTIGREVGQTIQGESGLLTFPDLPSDSLDSPPGGRLCCGHTGRCELPHGHRETVQKCDVERRLGGAQLQHRTSLLHDVSAAAGHKCASADCA